MDTGAACDTWLGSGGPRQAYGAIYRKQRHLLSYGLLKATNSRRHGPLISANCI